MQWDRGVDTSSWYIFAIPKGEELIPTFGAGMNMDWSTRLVVQGFAVQTSPPSYSIHDQEDTPGTRRCVVSRGDFNISGIPEEKKM